MNKQKFVFHCQVRRSFLSQCQWRVERKFPFFIFGCCAQTTRTARILLPFKFLARRDDVWKFVITKPGAIGWTVTTRHEEKRKEKITAIFRHARPIHRCVEEKKKTQIVAASPKLTERNKEREGYQFTCSKREMWNLVGHPKKDLKKKPKQKLVRFSCHTGIEFFCFSILFYYKKKKKMRLDSLWTR